jgi:hypothetical protein
MDYGVPNLNWDYMVKRIMASGHYRTPKTLKIAEEEGVD